MKSFSLIVWSTLLLINISNAQTADDGFQQFLETFQHSLENEDWVTFKGFLADKIYDGESGCGYESCDKELFFEQYILEATERAKFNEVLQKTFVKEKDLYPYHPVVHEVEIYRDSVVYGSRITKVIRFGKIDNQWKLLSYNFFGNGFYINHCGPPIFYGNYSLDSQTQDYERLAYAKELADSVFLLNRIVNYDRYNEIGVLANRELKRYKEKEQLKYDGQWRLVSSGSNWGFNRTPDTDDYLFNIKNGAITIIQNGKEEAVKLNLKCIKVREGSIRYSLDWGGGYYEISLVSTARHLGVGIENLKGPFLLLEQTFCACGCTVMYFESVD